MVRPEALKHITLRLSAEGKHGLYLAQDRSSGKIYMLTQRLAMTLRRMRAATLDVDEVTRQTAKSMLTEDALKEGYAFILSIRQLRDQERLGAKSFNPIFAAIPLFDVGPFQPRLHRIAHYIVSPAFPIFLLILSAICFSLGVRNDWGILASFQDVFSLQAILTFGAIAPVLKLIHELGHVLVATRYGVRVRQAGLYLIGLYPMPFVDCTEADMSASRRHRIMISLAGIATDMALGLSAFALWHISEGDFTQSLLGNIFVFSTLNSVLFNANPLVKLDGYYALSDAIGHRNFSTTAATRLRDLRRWVGSFGNEGALPDGRSGWATIAYAMLALLYRIKILFTIGAALIPKYLGAGALLVAWGSIVMFIMPILRDTPRAAQPNPSTKTYRLAWYCGTLTILVLALTLLRLPHVIIVPLTLQQSGDYHVSTVTGGLLTYVPHTTKRANGDQLALLMNPELISERKLRFAQLEIANALYEAVQGIDPAQAIAAQEQVDSLNEQISILDQQITGLSLVAQKEIVFVPHPGLKSGAWLSPGTPIGSAYPTSEKAQFSGPFPERYVSTYRDGISLLTLRIGKTYVDLPSDTLGLREIMSFDQETGKRSWELNVTLTDQPAAYFTGKLPDAKIRFKPVPLWQHVHFFWIGLIEKYRESQLADRAKFLE